MVVSLLPLTWNVVGQICLVYGTAGVVYHSPVQVLPRVVRGQVVQKRSKPLQVFPAFAHVVLRISTLNNEIAKLSPQKIQN